MGIDLCYNKFLHLYVQHQYYPEHDTVCLSIFFPWIFYCFFPDQKHHFGDAILLDGVEIPELSLHHLFGCQCAFESGNKICLMQELEKWTSIDIYIMIINSIDYIYNHFVMPRYNYDHRWELPGNYPNFTMLMVIYHYVERIWRIIITPNFLRSILDHE